MSQVFFFSPDGYAPLKDDVLKGLIVGSHGWQSDGDTWVYGVCYPAAHINPNDVVDRLEALGVSVIPGIHDPDTDPQQKVIDALAKHGIKRGDKGKDIAKKMHAACGMPHLKPHLF